MKLKRLRDKTNTEATPRWVWQLVWIDPCSKREQAERIGYYCRARDGWRPRGKRLTRLSEREAQAARERKVQQLKAAQTGIIVPAIPETRQRWRDYCSRTGQTPGLALERVLLLVDSEPFRRFEEACLAFSQRVDDAHRDLLTDWVERKQSNAPETWAELTKWYKNEGSPNAGHRTGLESKRTHDLFKELCPELTLKWQVLTRDDALVFHNRLMGKFESVMTVRKHLANMRKLWAACRRAWVKGNPWAELKFPKAEADPDSWHYFPADEVKKLLDAADLVWKARIRLAWKCGLRPGEIDHLRITDVDWKESRVHVRKHQADDIILAWTPKDKDARSIPIDPETLLELQKLRAKAPLGSPYLFLSERRWRQALALQTTGKWRKDLQLVCGKGKRWDAIIADAGIKADDGAPVFYALRKTCCCDLLVQGVPVHEVRQLMGHADIETTLRWYSKVNKEDAERRIRQAQTQAG